MSRSFPDSFDPAAVPTYPVLTVTIHAAAAGQGGKLYWVDVDGDVVSLGPDIDAADPRQIAAAGVHHVSEECRHRGWDAVRVKAVDADADTWMMIVGPNDQVMDLTVDTDEQSLTGRRRRRIIWGMVAGIVAATVGIAGIIVGVLIPHSHPGPDQADATPVPVELPVPAPAGWSTHATWGVHDRYQGMGALATGGSVWSISSGDDGGASLDQADPASGHVLTSQSIEGDDVTGLSTTGVEGHQVVAATGVTTVTYLDPAHPDDVRTAHATDDQQVHASGECTWAVGEQSLALLTLTGLESRTLPAASTPIGCHGDTLVTADTLGHVWQVGDATLTPTPQTLTPPAKDAKLSGVIAVHDGVVLADWTTDSGHAIAQWWNLDSTTQIATDTHDTALTAIPDHPDTHTGRWSTVGPAVIDWKTHHLIEPPTPDTSADAAVAGHWAWWSTDSTSAVVNLDTGHTDTLAVAAGPAQPQFALGDKIGVIDQDSSRPGLYLLTPKEKTP